MSQITDEFVKNNPWKVNSTKYPGCGLTAIPAIKTKLFLLDYQ